MTVLPFWPRYLSRVEAARYLGVSVDVFDDEVKEGLWPAARRRGGKGGRLTWDRVLLDATADQASGIAARPTAPPGLNPGENRWTDRINGKTEKRRA